MRAAKRRRDYASPPLVTGLYFGGLLRQAEVDDRRRDALEHVVEVARRRARVEVAIARTGLQLRVARSTAAEADRVDDDASAAMLVQNGAEPGTEIVDSVPLFAAPILPSATWSSLIRLTLAIPWAWP
jgi:hypothetical protein